jgi:cytochrome P450
MVDPIPADFVLDPDDPAFASDPFPTYAWLREHAPVYRWDKGRAFLISRHADVEQLLRDPRFSTNPRDWIHAACPTSAIVGSCGSASTLRPAFLDETLTRHGSASAIQSR